MPRSRDRRPAGSIARFAVRAAWLAPALAALGITAPLASHAATSFWSGSTSVCRTNASDADRCHADGGSTQLGGSPVNVSVNHMWSYVAPGDPYSFAVDGRAALGFASPERWSAYAGAGGYFNTPGSYLSDAVSATASMQVWDSINVAHTAAWNGYGSLSLSYRITGSVAAQYSASSGPNTTVTASAVLSFRCGSAAGKCTSPQNPGGAQPGSDLYVNFSFDSDTAVDQIVTLNVPLYSDTDVAFFLETDIGARFGYSQQPGPAVLVTGLVGGDFTHTGVLVDVDLLDAAGQSVDGWSATSASGLDYASVAAAVPEPETWALMLAGLGLVGAMRRRKQ